MIMKCPFHLSCTCHRPRRSAVLILLVATTLSTHHVTAADTTFLKTVPYIHPSPTDYLVESLRSHASVPAYQTRHWTDDSNIGSKHANLRWTARRRMDRIMLQDEQYFSCGDNNKRFRLNNSADAFSLLNSAAFPKCGAGDRLVPACSSLQSGPLCLQLQMNTLGRLLIDHKGILDGSLYKQRILHLLSDVKEPPKLWLHTKHTQTSAEAQSVQLTAAEWRELRDEILPRRSSGAYLTAFLLAAEFQTANGRLSVPETNVWFAGPNEPSEYNLSAGGGVALRDRRTYLSEPNSDEAKAHSTRNGKFNNYGTSNAKFNEADRHWYVPGSELPDHVLTSSKKTSNSDSVTSRSFFSSDSESGSTDPERILLSPSYSLYDVDINPPPPPLSSFEETLSPLPGRNMPLTSRLVGGTLSASKSGMEYLNRGLLWIRSAMAPVLPALSHTPFDTIAVFDPKLLSDSTRAEGGEFELRPVRESERDMGRKPLLTDSPLLNDLPPKLRQVLFDEMTILRLLEVAGKAKTDIQWKLFAALFKISPHSVRQWLNGRSLRGDRTTQPIAVDTNKTFESLLMSVLSQLQGEDAVSSLSPLTASQGNVSQPKHKKAPAMSMSSIIRRGIPSPVRIIRDYLNPFRLGYQILAIQNAIFHTLTSILVHGMQVYINLMVRLIGTPRMIYHLNEQHESNRVLSDEPSSSIPHINDGHSIKQPSPAVHTQDNITAKNHEHNIDNLVKEYQDIFDPVLAPVRYGRYSGFSWSWEPSVSLNVQRGFFVGPHDMEAGLPPTISGEIRGSWFDRGNSSWSLMSQSGDISFVPSVVVESLWLSIRIWPKNCYLKITGFDSHSDHSQSETTSYSHLPPTALTVSFILDIHRPSNSSTTVFDAMKTGQLMRGSTLSRIAVVTLSWMKINTTISSQEIQLGKRSLKLMRQRLVRKDIDPHWTIAGDISEDPNSALQLHGIDLHVKKLIFSIDEPMIRDMVTIRGGDQHDLTLQQRERLNGLMATNTYLIYPDKFPSILVSAQTPTDRSEKKSNSTLKERNRIDDRQQQSDNGHSVRPSFNQKLSEWARRRLHKSFSDWDTGSPSGRQSLTGSYVNNPKSSSYFLDGYNSIVKDALSSQPLVNGDGIVLNPNFRSVSTELRMNAALLPVESGVLSLNVMDKFGRIFGHQFHDLSTVLYTEEKFEEGSSSRDSSRGEKTERALNKTKDDMISRLNEQFSALEESLENRPKGIRLKELNILTILEDEETGETTHETTRLDWDELLRQLEDSLGNETNIFSDDYDGEEDGEDLVAGNDILRSRREDSSGIMSQDEEEEIRLPAEDLAVQLSSSPEVMQRLMKTIFEIIGPDALAESDTEVVVATERRGSEVDKAGLDSPMSSDDPEFQKKELHPLFNRDNDHNSNDHNDGDNSLDGHLNDPYLTHMREIDQ